MAGESDRHRAVSVARTRVERACRARVPLVLAAHLPPIALDLIIARHRLPGRVRRLLTALGPAYAKLGQVLSTRTDVLPAAYVAELALLRDHMPVMPPPDLERMLARAFPDGVGVAFSHLEPAPIAAGTVAQVHAGRLLTGEKVAVKVLRPEIGNELRRNVAVLTFTAAVVQRFSTVSQVLDLHGMVLELRDLLLSQTDLEQEARNYRRFAREFAGDDGVVVPKVFGAVSGPEVLVAEFVDGIGPYDTQRLPTPGSLLARRVDDLVDDMIFVKGLCHADLHPGNFFWNSRGQVVLVDLGLVHQLTKEERNHLLAFYSAILDGFATFAATYLLRHFTTADGAAATAADAIPPRAFADVERVVHQHWIESAGRPAFSAMFVDVSKVLAGNGLRLKPTYSKLFLTLVTVEGYLYSLDPEFDTLANARRKRVERAASVALSDRADPLVFESFGTHSAAHFGPGDTPERAYANRDALVLDALGVGPDSFLIDVGCGRGKLMRAAADRGARVLGITVSGAEHQACVRMGLDCVRTGWEDFDRHHGQEYGKADAVAAIELDTHLATLHENRAGLLDLRLRRFFGWTRSRLRDDGAMFLQTVSVPEALLHDPAHRAAYDRVTEAAPWTGFSTLPQIIRCADPFLAVDSVRDDSSDLLPTYAFWRANISGHLPELRPLMGTEVLVYLRRQLDTLIWLAEDDLLRLYRVVFRAKPGLPSGRPPAEPPR